MDRDLSINDIAIAICFTIGVIGGWKFGMAFFGV